MAQSGVSTNEMRQPRSLSHRRNVEGILFGLLGVLCFSLTLPATRVAVPELGATIVGLGRAEVAAALAAVLLLILRERAQAFDQPAPDTALGDPPIRIGAIQRRIEFSTLSK